MGTWALGPFENDAAADFLDGLAASPGRGVKAALEKARAAKSLDTDDAGAAWAACELVALAFGRGETRRLDDRVLAIAGKLRPDENLRTLALEALPRLGDRKSSELAALWHEGKDGAKLDGALANLRARLEESAQGARPLPKPQKGDVIALSHADKFVVIQVLGAGEVAVFGGLVADEKAALASVAEALARRVPAPVASLFQRGVVVGNLPLRKDLRAKKLYAGETGAIEAYVVASASGAGARIAAWEEAQKLAVLRPHDEVAIRAIALGTAKRERLRSPDEREAELRKRNAKKWEARRKTTTPSPFGDLTMLADWVSWIGQYGVENAIARASDEAEGLQGYGRPNEDAERRSWAFAAVTALWRGWSEPWPPSLKLPAKPNAKLLAKAVEAARVLADNLITREAELRLIWGDALSAPVESLRAHLRK